MTSETAEQVQMFDRDSWFGKTYREPSAQTKERISELSSKKSSKSSTKTPLFLDLRTANGEMSALSWETDSPLLGVYSTHSFGESPSVAAESRLSQILEDTPHPKYSLSAKACQGILRRAEQRGKELPEVLRIALENHPTDCRVKISDDGMVQTLTSRMGTGGGNVPLVMGKQTTAYGICSKDSNGMKSSNPHVGFYEAVTARTLDANGGNPACNQGGIAVVAFTQNQRNEVRDLGEKSAVVCANAGTKQQTFVLQGNMIGRSEGNGPQGDGINEDVSFTLNTVDRHAVYAMTTGNFSQVTEDAAPTLMARDFKDPTAVCYGIGRDTFNQGRNAAFSPTFDEELQPTLVAKGSGAVQSGYTVRRLTPLECERLQGFPDGWTDIGEWTDSKGKAHKASDSARYKALGNSIALPPWRYVLSGVIEYCSEKTMASLFDGIGGFPLIWRELGGNTVWASEIEEFPIAVTKKHFNYGAWEDECTCSL